MAGTGSEIGARLRALRERRGLSQRSLAAPGVSGAYISRIERGQRTPSVKALRLLAPRLGVSPEYLETGSELGAQAARELQVAEAEVRLRLGEEREAAEAELSRLLRDAEVDGDRLSTIRARVALGSAAMQRGAHAEAIGLLEAALAEADIEPAGHPEFYAALAQSYVAIGEPDKAIELIEGSLGRIRQAQFSDATVETRFATYLSFILSDLGDMAGARAVLDNALTHIDPAAGVHSLVRLHWSRARLAESEEKHALAQSEIRQAIALLDLADDSRNLARAHLLYAESLIAERAQSELAERHISTAERLLNPALANHEMAWLCVLKANVLSRHGQAAEAQASAKRALELLGEFDPELRGRAETVLAVTFAQAGQTDEALAAFERADQLLEAAERRFKLQLFESWSPLLEQRGQLAEALEVARRAATVAAEMAKDASTGGSRVQHGTEGPPPDESDTEDRPASGRPLPRALT